MRYVRVVENGKKYVPLIPTLRNRESHTPEALEWEEIAVKYIELMYDIKLINRYNIWLMPDDVSSRIKWMAEKLKKIQIKIIKKRIV